MAAAIYHAMLRPWAECQNPVWRTGFVIVVVVVVRGAVQAGVA
jgi:hypothetical protein